VSSPTGTGRRPCSAARGVELWWCCSLVCMVPAICGEGTLVTDGVVKRPAAVPGVQSCQGCSFRYGVDFLSKSLSPDSIQKRRRLLSNLETRSQRSYSRQGGKTGHVD